MSFTWKSPNGRLTSPEDMMRVIIRVADELGMPDKRGACIIAGMTVRQEADFWRPGNNADPAFKADPNRFPHDSMGNDGRSVGPYQQQTGGPPPEPQWGWGGLYGDPEGTRKRMDPYESTKLFLSALKKRPYQAGSAREANNWAQDVQDSGVPDGYLKHWDFINELYDRVKGGAPAPTPPPPPPAPVWRPEPYGLPRGTNSGGYGNGGKEFPAWVHQLGNAFGLKPSTYPGHQEGNRNEAGYAPNPQNLNRGIDWAAPGAPDEVDRMQRFAEYCLSIRGELEQVIWQNPRTGHRIGVAGGKDVSNTPYYNADYGGHRNHVHTRQSHSLPLPGGAAPAPAPAGPTRPNFNEINVIGQRKISTQCQSRGGTRIDLLLGHTVEGNLDGTDLIAFMERMGERSYHYVISLDGKTVWDCVDTDQAAWAVLDPPNNRSINYVIGASFVAWSRQQWIDKARNAIRTMAYLMVQDAREYNVQPRVIPPPYNVGPPGISDHQFVTKKLGKGTHTDLGPNFPWDLLTSDVDYYLKGEEDDMFTEDDRRKLDIMFNEYRPDRKAPTRTFFGIDMGGVESPLGYLWNMDGNTNEMFMTWAYIFGVKAAEEAVEHIATHGVSPDSWAGKQIDEDGKAWLAQFGQEWCQGLVAFRKRLQAALRTPAPAEVRMVVNDSDGAELAATRTQLEAAYRKLDECAAENARLRQAAETSQALQRIQSIEQTVTNPPAVELASVVDDDPANTTAFSVAQVIRSIEDWTEVALEMNPKQRAALMTSLKVLESVKGTDK
jgi:hypothetical protein